MSLTDSTGTPGGFVHLVDGDGNYNTEPQKMKELLDYIDPKKDGSYTVVGIMGCQSGGKSTILNRLFATQFTMMDAAVRRGQTTKGIWLDAARNTKGLMIADLEGTDSGERGEDRTTFERQTILYALALCEILIMNMWETDIGRYTGSNTGLLKTVFEIYLQLFFSTDSKSFIKTQLLFIVRDYNEEGTPFGTLKARLLKEMHTIWDDITKPAHCANISLTDCFDFRFTYLPHFVYRRDKFEEMALKLQEKFIDPHNPDSFFDTEYHFEKSRSIPSADFAQYSENVWNTIKTNQDLNLPTQREMLATYRCDELVAQILSEYQTNIAPLREKALTGFHDTLGEDFSKYMTQSLLQYDQSCSKYIEGVVQRKRVELNTKLLEPVIEILSLNLKMFTFNTLVQQYEKAINADITPDEVCFGIMDICQTKTAETITKFHHQTGLLTQGLHDIAISNMVKRYESEFIEKLLDVTNILRKSQLHALFLTTLTEFDARSDVKLIELFQSGKADMWSKLGELYNTTLKTSLDSVKDELNSLAQTDDERQNTQRKIIEAAEYTFFDKAQRFVSTLPTHIKDRFESIFLYHKGQQRTWKGSDDPRTLFESARDEALQMLRTFRTFNLRQYISQDYLKYLTTNSPTEAIDTDNNNDGRISTNTTNTTQPQTTNDTIDTNNDTNLPPNATLKRTQSTANINTSYNAILITRDDLYRIETEFERKIQGHLQSAILEVERIRTQTGLPPWVYAVILFLGYNEFVWALSNPFILFFLMLLGLLVFILYQLRLLDTAITLGKAIGNRLFTELLRFIDPPAPQTQQITTTTTTTAPPTLQQQGTIVPSLSRQGSTVGDENNGPRLNLDQIPDSTLSQRSNNQTPANNSTTGQTPKNLNNNLDAMSGTSSLRRRPNYGTMTFNKKNMAALYQAGMESGYGDQK